MEIENPNCATLSNFEVLKHLQKIKDSKKKHKGQLATIVYETIRYLENTTCKDQTFENIQECLKGLTPYNLNKTEKLMIINSPPTTALEIQLVIEESEERLTEEQVDQILEVVTKCFPHTKKKTEENDVEDSD
ncbi:DNA-directed RNA polymerase III subunit RPC9 [Anoplophora glabripennis]|uniref:DNA-directed RNA polymerase III subunit RPC9 n=1 Tax=Anoplophora glabripennis TaxID=217634 RepID=UPI0008747323|nr:DNA-directed RNA polymerase III subunit RPC9 [Anoplophora glabripennis]